jgi:hypothetical protein
MKFSRNKTTATLIALFLMFAMAISLVALPAVSAQGIWSIYITARPDQARIQMEVRLDDVRVDETFTGVMLGIKLSGTTTWTYEGPMIATMGLIYYNYPAIAPGDQFQFIVPPQGSLPTNPDTTDGKWYSAIYTAAPSQNHYTSYVYVAVGPDPVGVNQEVLLVMWTADMPPDTGEIAAAAGERAHWNNIGFYVTDPEDNTETFTIAESDPVGGGYISYTPDQVGTYTVQAWFPATWKNGTWVEDYYTAGESPEVTFTVQEEPIDLWLESPLPTGYWTRPINQASREWYVLAGNWLGLGGWRGSEGCRPAGQYGGTTERFLYGKGTESAHILWTKPYYLGGIMDERYGVTGYQTGHYQGLSFEAIVINGKMYYSPRADAHRTEGYICVDLYTGETLWTSDERMPSYGQIYNYESPNQHGGYAYLWRTSGVTLPEIVRVAQAQYNGANTIPIRLGSNIEINTTETPIRTGTLWEMIDAYTGTTVCYVANVTSARGAAPVYGKDGSLLRYQFENIGGTYYLQVWNSSAGTMIASETGTGTWQWRPSGGSGAGASASWFGSTTTNNVHDGNLFWSLNVSIPNLESTSIQCVREGEYIIVGTSGSNTESGVVQGKMSAYSLELGREGTKLWDTTFTPPAAAANSSVGLTGVYPEDGVILFSDSKRLLRWGISLDTGELLWEGEPEPQMNYYSMYTNYYQGLLLSPSWSGYVLAYNITTGEIVWKYHAKNVGYESPYGDYPINIFAICDGKIYTLTGEHSISQPMYRGPNIRCINATDGTEIWKTLGFSANGGASLGGQYAQMADGKVIALNYLDNQIYCFGPGSSATTVSAPQTVPTVGSSVVITGTVTDQTETGRRNTNGMFDFSLKGTPAISDEDMGEWMAYMFQQQAMPADAKGVEVVLETLDPNGNFYEIGRTTSDMTGAYGLTWEPPVPGDYKIIATFAGSAAYGCSRAMTYMSIAEAPEPTPEPTPTPASIADMYLVPGIIGIIIAIAVVGAVIVLMLRKR